MSASGFPSASMDQAPPVCIVLPTYNRLDILILCLRHLELQTESNFEVVIVDDGSTDDTPQFLEQFAATTTLRLRYARQQNSGPARARNLAVSLTQSPVCLFIGDDILVSPDFVAIHAGFHQANPDIRFAALGLTKWSETEQTVTPFMRWLDNGVQFDYNSLIKGAAPYWGHFYTSNLSIKTELLRRQPFNESFTSAHMEDIEAGYRLHLFENLQLTFLPGALAEHVHPTDFRTACRRAVAIGGSHVYFESLWPDAFPKGSWFQRTRRSFFGRCAWLLPLAAWVGDQVTRVWCPNPLMQRVLSLHDAVGRRRARKV